MRNIEKHQIGRAELVFRSRIAKTNFLDHRVQWCKQYIIDIYKKLDEKEILSAFQKWLDELNIIQFSQKPKSATVGV